jgi:hypothetical protein
MQHLDSKYREEDVVDEGDFWGKSVAEFSHSLGQKRLFSRV